MGEDSQEKQNVKQTIYLKVRIFKKPRLNREDIRKKVILQVMQDLIGETLSAQAILDKVNALLKSQQKLTNSKQMGLYIRRLKKESGICMIKKVVFVEPKTSLIQYHFFNKRCDKKEACPIKSHCDFLNEEEIPESRGEGD